MKKLTKEEFQQNLIDRGITDVKIIGDYKGSSIPTLFECNGCEDNCQWMARPYNILKGNKSLHHKAKRIANFNKISIEEFKERVKVARPKLTVLEFNGVKKPCILQCDKGHIWNYKYGVTAMTQPISEDNQCPYCSRFFKDMEKDSIAVKRPDLVKYFLNQEEALIYTEFSNKRTTFVCPICGAEKESRINDISTKGFHCQVCFDGMSIPNKFIRSILMCLKDKIDFLKFEYSPNWLNGQRMDAYFEIDKKKYCVEMQGPQHSEECCGVFSSQTLSERQELDQKKRQLCRENNVIEIEINSFYSDFEFLKNNILKSELSNIFDLKEIKLNEIYEQCMTTILYDFVNLYKQGYSVTQIAEKTKYNRMTVTKYLQIGRQLDLVDYVEHQNYKKTKITNITTNEELIFQSQKKAIEYILQATGLKLTDKKFKKSVDEKILIEDTFLIEQ